MAAWRSQTLSMFAFNESVWTRVCEASAVDEQPLWRYLKHELNALAWASLIVITFLLLRRMGALLRLWIKARRLPGPPTRALSERFLCPGKAQGPQMLQDLFSVLHKEHGPVVKIWTGPTELLVSITDTKILKYVLEHAKDRVPASRMALQLAYGKRSLFVSAFSEVEEPRANLKREFNGTFLGQVHSTSVKVGQNIKLWAEPVDNENWELDCSSSSKLMAFAVLGTSIFGEEYVNWPVAREFEKLVATVAEELVVWMRYRVPPLWNSKFNQFRKQCERLRVLARQVVAQDGEMRVQELKETQTEGKAWNGVTEGFVGSLISSMVVESSVVESRATGIMSHGSLSTAGILSGVLTQLAQHPDIQAKVYDEINLVSGSSNSPTKDDLKKMIYLMATVHEAARLHPPVPILQRCSVDQDLELEPGVVVPAGAILAAPIQLLQLDGTHWGADADTFNPDRFLRASERPEDAMEGECVHKSNHEQLTGKTEKPTFRNPAKNPAFLGFGAGSRACIGRDFALTEIATLVAVILQQFQLKLAPMSTKDPMPKVKNPALHHSPSARLLLSPRQARS